MKNESRQHYINTQVIPIMIGVLMSINCTQKALGIRILS